MSELTKQALKVENNQSFPNNNAGLITPSALRTFNEDMIDSLVDVITYTADSGSWNQQINALEQFTASASGLSTGSLLITASFNDGTRNLTFTKGDGSTFAVNIPDVSGSTIDTGSFITDIQNNVLTPLTLIYTDGSGATNVTLDLPSGIVSGSGQITPLLPSGVVSGSSQINYPQISNIPSGIVSGSSQVSYTGLSNIPSGIVSGAAQITPLLPSGTISGSAQVVSALPAGTVSGSSQVVLQDTTYTDGVLDQFLSTDGAGNLSFDWVKTLHQNIRNRDSVTITRGTPLYVSGSTGDNADVFVADASNPLRRPATLIAFDSTLAPAATGTAIISGEIQNVNTTGFPAGTVIYLAPGGGYTATRPTGSASVQVLGVVTLEATNGRGIVFNQVADSLPNIQQGYTWVGNSNGVPVAVTSGSLSSYIFNQDNTFSGTQTFNNIAVNGTASIAYLESVTGSAKIIGDAFIILNNDTPTERYAGIIVLDSGSAGTSASFQFDGLTNDWFYEYTGSDPLNFGVALFGPEYGTKGSPTYNANNKLVKGDGGHHLNDSNITDDGSTVSINSNTQITGSLLVNGNAPLINSDLGPLNAFTQSIQAEVDSLQSVTGSYATTGSNTFNGNQIVNGTSTQTFTAPSSESEIPLITLNGAVVGGTPFNNVRMLVQDYPSLGQTYTEAIGFEYWDSLSYLYGSEFTLNGKEITLAVVPTGSAINAQFRILDNGASKAISDWNATEMYIGTSLSRATDFIRMGNTGLDYIRLTSQKNEITGSTFISGSTEITDSIRVSGNLTASLQEGYVWVGNSSGITTTVATSSFGGGGTDISSLNAFTASQELINTGYNSFTQSADSRLNNIELTTASLQSEVDNLQSVTGSYATTGSNSFVGNQIITGSVNISGSAAVDLTVVGAIQVTGSAAAIRTSINNQQIVLVNNTNSNRAYPTSIQDGFFNNTNPTNAQLLLAVFDEPNFVNDVEFNIQVTSGSGTEFRDWDNVTTLGYQTWLSIAPNLGNFPDVEFKRSVQVTGSVNIQSTLTASLQQGYVWVGDVNGRTTTVPTSSFGGGGSAFPFTGDAQISGSLGVTGSMSGFVNTLGVTSQTASVNFNDGNMFVITLPTGSVTHFTPTNIKAGQTINIQISQVASATTGSVTFSPNVRFAGGNDYQATATGSAIDLLTFVSLDGTNVLGTSIKNFL